jgi:hypothetical protein
LKCKINIKESQAHELNLIKTCFLLLLILTSYYVKGQNLISNGSIEELTIPCILHRTGPTPNTFAKDITAAVQTPDIFNECAPRYYGSDINYMINVPYNYQGFQYARTGKGMAGFWYGDPFDTVYYINQYRESICFKLKDSLIPNQRYVVRFYCVLSNTCGYGTDAMEAILSPVDTVDANYQIPFSSSISHKGKGHIIDTMNWTAVYDTIVADGSEKYFHIIKRTKLNHQNYMPIRDDPDFALHYIILLYHFDDVAIWSLDTIAPIADAGDDKLVCYGDSVLIGTHSYQDYYYSWKTKDSLLYRDDTLGQIWVKPKSSKWYYLQCKDFKYDASYDSVFVEVLDCRIAIDDTSKCKNTSIHLGRDNPMYDNYKWYPSQFIDDSTSSNPRSFTNTDLMYYVSATDSAGVTHYDSVFIKSLSCDIAIDDIVICKGSSIPLGSNNSNYSEYLWTPSSNLNDSTSSNPIFTTGNNTEFTVIAKDSLGYLHYDTVRVSVRFCESGNDGRYVLLYPNPSSDIVYVEWDSVLFPLTSLQLFTVTGQLIKTWNGINGSFQFSVKDFSSGLYFYTFNSKNGTKVSGKLIIL